MVVVMELILAIYLEVAVVVPEILNHRVAADLAVVVLEVKVLEFLLQVLILDPVLVVLVLPFGVVAAEAELDQVPLAIELVELVELAQLLLQKKVPQQKFLVCGVWKNSMTKL
tara:strand:- start:1542 stop:1880 length:339 start_codon:yes stop_codon:yes gene_type:complete